jgi:hypothetical protein
VSARPPGARPAGGRPPKTRGRILRPVAGGRTRRGRGGLFNLTRLVGALVMLGASFALNWLTSPDNFRLDPAKVTISGVHYTDETLARERLGLAADAAPNVFRLRTLPMASAVAELPAVARTEARVALPDALNVVVTERTPVFVWQAAGQAVLVDPAGVAISAAPTNADLPVVIDARRGAGPLAVGEQLDSIALAAVLKLAALTPESLGSGAQSLGLAISDEDGFTLVADDPDWRAVFGHYTPNLRPVELIDAQVQCLRSLLAEREERLSVIYLAPAEDRCGTFRERPTPGGRTSQNVGTG